MKRIFTETGSFHKLWRPLEFFQPDFLYRVTVSSEVSYTIECLHFPSFMLFVVNLFFATFNVLFFFQTLIESKIMQFESFLTIACWVYCHYPEDDHHVLLSFVFPFLLNTLQVPKLHEKHIENHMLIIFKGPRGDEEEKKESTKECRKWLHKKGISYEILLHYSALFLWDKILFSFP